MCESVRAILQGQGVDDMDPFIDLLFAEEYLKAGAEPLVSELLAVAIGQGMDLPQVFCMLCTPHKCLFSMFYLFVYGDN